MNTKYIRKTDNNRLKVILNFSYNAILEIKYQYYKKTNSIKANQLLDKIINCRNKVQKLLKVNNL